LQISQSSPIFVGIIYKNRVFCNNNFDFLEKFMLFDTIDYIPKVFYVVWLFEYKTGAARSSTGGLPCQRIR